MPVAKTSRLQRARSFADHDGQLAQTDESQEKARPVSARILQDEWLELIFKGRKTRDNSQPFHDKA